jgi:hypothetical protein
MKIESFELKPVKFYRELSDKKISSFQLLLNGELISNNLAYLAYEPEGLLQLEVCSECFKPGCNKGGYVQVLETSENFIWKEPLISVTDDFTRKQYTTSKILKNGTIFWKKIDYQKFENSFNSEWYDKILKNYVQCTPSQGFDLWRIYGSKHLCPQTNYSLAIDEIQTRLLNLFSTKFNREDCLKVFSQANDDYLKAKKVNLKELPFHNKDVTVISIRQLDYLCIVDNHRFYPVGENLAIEFLF